MFSFVDIKRILNEADKSIDVDSLVYEAGMSEQGIDSMLKMDLLLRIEEDIDVFVPNEDVALIVSFKDLVSYCNKG